jgi:hypothetical protein
VKQTMDESTFGDCWSRDVRRGREGRKARVFSLKLQHDLLSR